MLKTEELKAEIRRMCEEKGAIILAHYYTIGDIQNFRLSIPTVDSFSLIMSS